MKKKSGKESNPQYDFKALEKDAEVVCQDFAVFCNYIIENKVKLSKRTGNMGEKDCFALNSLMYVR